MTSRAVGGAPCTKFLHDGIRPLQPGLHGGPPRTGLSAPSHLNGLKRASTHGRCIHSQSHPESHRAQIAAPPAGCAFHYYRQIGLRSKNDFDVLVPTGKLEPALTALRAIGWTPVALPNGRGFSLAATGLYHSWGFRNESTRGELDLVHAYASHDPVIRWVADAAMIMRAAGDQIDWDRFADQTSRRHLVLPVRVALGHLHDSGLVPIPIGAIHALESARVGWMDRAEYVHRQSRHPYSLSNKLARLWFWNWRLRGHAPSLSTAASFPGFLRRYTAH